MCVSFNSSVYFYLACCYCRPGMTDPLPDLTLIVYRIDVCAQAMGARATDALLNYETVKYFTNEQ